MNSNVLKITLETLKGNQSVNWVCQNFTSTQLKVQLLFADPMEVSSIRTDTIVLEFLVPSLFVLNTKTQYLF